MKITRAIRSGLCAVVLGGLTCACTMFHGARTPQGNDYCLEKNIPYYEGVATNQDSYITERCQLDLYYPEGKTNFSTVVWFHGGGLRSGNRGIPAELKGKGLAVVAVGYRLFPKVHAPRYVEDAAASVAWVYKHIGNYGGDTNKIFLTGHSAGAYLADLISLDPVWLAQYDVNSDSLAGVISLSGQVITHFTVREERGQSNSFVVVDALAPLQHVHSNAPPFVIITGDRDLELMGRYEENAYFWRMMKLVGHQDVALHEMKGCNHGGMIAPSFPILLDFVQRREQELRKPLATPQ